MLASSSFLQPQPTTKQERKKKATHLVPGGQTEESSDFITSAGPTFLSEENETTNQVYGCAYCMDPTSEKV
jgi:hypothetical protein